MHSPSRPGTASSLASSHGAASPASQDRPLVTSPTPSDSIAPQLQAALRHQLHPQREVHSASSASLALPLKSAMKPSSQPITRTGTADRESAESSDDRRGFTVGVAFDIMDDEPRRTGGGTGVDASFTLRSRSVDYERTKSSREFLVCTDLNEYSTNALDWTLDNMVEDGDEIVILRVLEPKSEATQKDADEAKAEAQQVMDEVLAKATAQLSVVVEFVVGPLHTSLQRIIALYRPDSMIVGTRGRSETLWRSAFIGSTSRYALERSPVPVIVVRCVTLSSWTLIVSRPQRKVKAALEARANDPKRRSYAALVEDENGRDEGLKLRPTQTMPIPTEDRKSRSPVTTRTTQPRTQSLDRAQTITFADSPTPSRS